MTLNSLKTEENKNSLQKLLLNWPVNALYVSSWLTGHGYPYELIQKYINSKWLKSPAKGIFLRHQDEITWQGAIWALQKQLNLKIHVGSKSALELLGYAHYLPLNKQTISIIVPKNNLLPKWITKLKFNAKIKTYSTNIFKKTEVSSLTEIKNNNLELILSAPERAIIEMMYRIPSQYTFQETAEIFTSLTTLRPELVQILLENCTSIKAKRIFLFLAELNNHKWFSKINTSKVELGKGKRVIEKNGIFNSKYLITVPKELIDQEDTYE